LSFQSERHARERIVPVAFSTPAGDIDHLIADDHAVLERLFQHLQAGRGDRRVLADQVVYHLSVHTDAEERLLYPELARLGRKGAAHAGVEGHRLARELIDKLTDAQPGQPDFEDALTLLARAVRAHMVEEETEVLPALRRSAGAARMAELGEEFLAAKHSAPSRPHRATSRLGHALGDPAARVVDRLRDKVSGRSALLHTDRSGLLDPQAQRLLDHFGALGATSVEVLAPREARAQPTLANAVERMVHAEQIRVVPDPVGRVENRTIPGPDGQNLAVRVYFPDVPEVLPVGGETLTPMVLWIHGGGWVLQDLDTADASCRAIVGRTGAVVVSPDYRRAPEHVFPAAHDDVLAAYRWMREHALSLGGDARRIVIGGESVGGGMAAAACWTLRRAGEPGPVAQVLVYPQTTAVEYGASMLDAADAPPLTRPVLSWMMRHAFYGKPEAVDDPRVNLLALSAQDLALLPPTLIITDERDVLRDQGEEFGKRLAAAGVPLTMRRFDGVMHGFFAAGAVLDAARQAQRMAAEHVLAHAS
jgi:acetyl esterase/lipase